MAYIKEFAVQRLGKNAVVEFFEYLMSLIELCQSLKTNLPEQYEAIKAAAAEVQKWAELTLKSNLTAKIHDLDAQRDSFLIALENALKALVRSLDQETRDKAVAVQNKYDSINVNRQAQYFQESGAIDRLLGALLGPEMLEDVTSIGVLPLLNMLKEANDEMHRLLLERGIDEAQVPEQAFEKARRAAETVYREFVFMVNAYIAMYVVRPNRPDAEIGTFVQNLNRFLHKYKITQFNSATKGDDALTPPESGEGEGTPGEPSEPSTPGSPSTPNDPSNPTDPADPSLVTALFTFHSGQVEEILAAAGAALAAPTNTTGYLWTPDVPAVMPAANIRFVEVPEGVQLYQLVWYLPDGNPLEWFELPAGMTIPPAPPAPEGYEWHPYPDVMPARDMDIIPNPVRS